MFTAEDDLIINNISMGKYMLAGLKIGFMDTWSSNSGYNLANKFKGTFKGTFLKLTIPFRELEPNEIQYLSKNIFRKPFQTVTYNDPVEGKKTITTHKGDLQLEWDNIDKSKSFNYQLVSNEVISS